MPTLPPNRIIRRNKIAGQVRNLTFPEDIGPHGMLFIFKNYEYKSTRSLLNGATPSVIQGSSILLPIPNSIQDSFSLKVNAFDQGTFGDVISRGAAGAAESGGSNVIGGLANALRDAMPSGTNIAQDLFGDTGRGIGGVLDDMGKSANFLLRTGLDSLGANAARNIDAGFGSTINPKSALSFEGVNLKKHSFDWTFAPKRSEESDILRDISSVIKKNVLPSYSDANFGGQTFVQRAMLNYPSAVDIYFIGVEQSYYYYFKTCMVDQFGMNYAPQGLAILKGGKPAVVNMNLQLSEMDIHTAEDYDSSGGDTVNIASSTPTSSINYGP